VAIIRARDARTNRYRHLVMFMWGLPWSGKTFSLLKIGCPLAALLKRGNGKPGDGRLCVIDTESTSTLDYQEHFDFDVLPLDAPYTPERFIAALYEVKSAGYSVVGIDSLSSEWNESGGILREIDKLKETSRANPWSVMTPRHERLLEEMNKLGLPVLVTAKSSIKTGIEERVDDRGNKKAVPVKLGEKAIFRPEDEYQFKIICQLEQTKDSRLLHFNGKCRVPALDGKTFANPGDEVASLLTLWIKGESQDKEDSDQVHPITDEKPGAFDGSTGEDVSQTTSSSTPRTGRRAVSRLT